VIDTLVHAKELHPGKRNSLDALCDRYGVSNAHRKLHGALLDAELLADVYLAMTRGQNSLGMDVEEEVVAAANCWRRCRWPTSSSCRRRRTNWPRTKPRWPGWTRRSKGSASGPRRIAPPVIAGLTEIFASGGLPFRAKLCAIIRPASGG
jgi:DNA polymerase III epsilon subunit-like protein